MWSCVTLGHVWLTDAAKIINGNFADFVFSIMLKWTLIYIYSVQSVYFSIMFVFILALCLKQSQQNYICTDFACIFLRRLWWIWKDRFMHLKAVTWRTLRCTGTSFEDGTDIWPIKSECEVTSCGLMMYKS